MHNKKEYAKAIYIAELPRNITDRDLFEIFQKYGQIQSITLKDGFAFLDFDNANSVEEAIKGESNLVIKGKKVLVQRRRKPNFSNPKPVPNLPTPAIPSFLLNRPPPQGIPNVGQEAMLSGLVGANVIPNIGQEAQLLSSLVNPQFDLNLLLNLLALSNSSALLQQSLLSSLPLLSAQGNQTSSPSASQSATPSGSQDANLALLQNWLEQQQKVGLIKDPDFFQKIKSEIEKLDPKKEKAKSNQNQEASPSDLGSIDLNTQPPNSHKENGEELNRRQTERGRSQRDNNSEKNRETSSEGSPQRKFNPPRSNLKRTMKRGNEKKWRNKEKKKRKKEQNPNTVQYSNQYYPDYYYQYDPNQSQYIPSQPQYTPNQPQYDQNQSQYYQNQSQYDQTQSQYTSSQSYQYYYPHPYDQYYQPLHYRTPYMNPAQQSATQPSPNPTTTKQSDTSPKQPGSYLTFQTPTANITVLKKPETPSAKTAPSAVHPATAHQLPLAPKPLTPQPLPHFQPFSFPPYPAVQPPKAEHSYFSHTRFMPTPVMTSVSPSLAQRGRT